jgi:hypothetical protein
MSLHIKGSWFVDEAGRAVMLRGVGLGGSSKVPATPDGSTHIKTDFLDHRTVSFVNRPFPLEQADEHFGRLQHWGFNCVRLVVPWEALEHAGPGEYDDEFIDYMSKFLACSASHDIYTFIDAHQDVWCRMCAGDGAPGWTLEQVGFDISKLEAAEAAWTMQGRFDPADPKTFPPSTWSHNQLRLAAATMWTLFFASRDFAPSCSIDGAPAQDYLQDHLVGAFTHLAAALKDVPNILGYDALNEPNPGWIGRLVDGSNTPGLNETLGYTFMPIDAMATGAGFTRKVGYREIKKFGVKETRKDDMNAAGVTCWQEGKDVWRNEGVWGLDDEGQPTILKNEHFMAVNDQPVEFYHDYLSPFIRKFTAAIHEENSGTPIFFEGQGEPVLRGETLKFDIGGLDNVVWSPHWYDVATVGMKRGMFTASFNIRTNRPVLGEGNITSMFVEQLGALKEFGTSLGCPTMLGEVGVPYDLDNKDAYTKWKEDPDAWHVHVKALGFYYDALDANLMSSVQWNYTPDNDNQWGDRWNLEDFSIFSRDQQDDPSNPDNGGRAIAGFCRPRCVRCAGVPSSQAFDTDKGTFTFQFEVDTNIDAPTILYVPAIQYPNGYSVSAKGCSATPSGDQLLEVTAAASGPCAITITREK